MPERIDVMTYPQIERQPVIDRLHGYVVPDPYRRLEDPSDPRTREWQAGQDELWRRCAAELPGRERLHERVAELSRTGMITAPMWRGERRFLVRQDPGQEHAVLYAVEPDGRERTLVDPMTLDPSGTVTLDHWQPDGDGRRLAFQLSRRGTEQSELFVLDVDSGDMLDGPIGGCRYSPVAWLPGGAAFYYVRAIGGRPCRVYLHKVGRPAALDAAILGSGDDPSVSYGLELDPAGRWLCVSAVSGRRTGNDLWLADLSTSDPSVPDLQVVQRDVDARTVATVGPDGRMYVVTDLACPSGRLCVADPTRPGPESWRELVRSPGDAVLAEFAVLDDVLVIAWTRHATSELVVYDRDSGERRGTVPLPGPGSVTGLSARGSQLWFTYTDAVRPGSIHRYDARAGLTALWERAPGAVAVPDVESHEVVCTSADGTPVWLVIIGRASPDHRPRPAILYGYGGFGVAVTPTYSSFSLAWVEAGGIFVTAHLRGGSEEGERWHRDGMLDGKQNVIDDFLAAAQLLLADGWTTSAQLGICGESNGGLVVGAALTRRPDLFAAAVCSAPVLDMARYERSGLGASWRSEYGTAADPEQLGWLLSYSPYHNVRSGVDYPAVLFSVYGGDTRVDPMHARKMCAALQYAAGGDRPILLRFEPDVGHGSRAASRAVGQAADMLAFLAAHTGLEVA